MPSSDERAVSSPQTDNQQQGRGSSTGALLASLVAGAALAYLFDPARGAKRRALLRDQVASMLRSAGRDVNAKAIDIRQRGQGLVAEARNRMSDEPVSDEQLVARVRAALGHRIESVRPIEVVAEGGRIVLRGQVGADDIETAVATARGVRGVGDVDNQMQAATGTPGTSAVNEIPAS